MRLIFVFLAACVLGTSHALAQDIPEIWPAEVLGRDMGIVPRELLADGLYIAPASFFHVELKAFSMGELIMHDQISFDSLSPGRINELGPFATAAGTNVIVKPYKRLACFKPDGLNEESGPVQAARTRTHLDLPQLGIGQVLLDCVSAEGAEQLRFSGIECELLIEGADEIEITIWQRENSSPHPDAFFIGNEFFTPEGDTALWTAPAFEETDTLWRRIVSYKGVHKHADAEPSLY